MKKILLILCAAMLLFGASEDVKQKRKVVRMKNYNEGKIKFENSNKKKKTKHGFYGFVGNGMIFGGDDRLGVTPLYFALGYNMRVNDYFSWRIYGDFSPFLANFTRKTTDCYYYDYGYPNSPTPYCTTTSLLSGGPKAAPIVVDIIYDVISRNDFKLGIIGGFGASAIVAVNGTVSADVNAGVQFRFNLGLKAMWQNKHNFQILLHLPLPLFIDGARAIYPNSKMYQGGVGLIMGYARSI